MEDGSQNQAVLSLRSCFRGCIGNFDAQDPAETVWKRARRRTKESRVFVSAADVLQTGCFFFQKIEWINQRTNGRASPCPYVTGFNKHVQVVYKRDGELLTEIAAG